MASNDVKVQLRIGTKRKTINIKNITLEQWADLGMNSIRLKWQFHRDHPELHLLDHLELQGINDKVVRLSIAKYYKLHRNKDNLHDSKTIVKMSKEYMLKLISKNLSRLRGNEASDSEASEDSDNDEPEEIGQDAMKAKCKMLQQEIAKRPTIDDLVRAKLDLELERQKSSYLISKLEEEKRVLQEKCETLLRIVKEC